MARLYFHCSNSEGVLVDRRGAAMGNLVEAHAHAACVVRSLIATLSSEDWRDWIVHVSDDLNDEIFAVSFSSLLGKPH